MKILIERYCNQLILALPLAVQMKKNASSKFMGVTYCPGKRKWQAGITISGRSKYIGYFITEEEAAKAFDKEVVKREGRQNSLRHIA